MTAGGESRLRKRALRNSRFGRLCQRIGAPILDWRVPRGFGVIATAVIVVGSVSYGVVRGEHTGELITQWQDFRDSIANDAGFAITQVSLSGQRAVSRDDILAAAGVNARASLLFFDVGFARERLKAQPWIADATVVKYFPNRLDISVTEREAFALWQKDRQVSVVAVDGTVLEQYEAGRFDDLPLVVGDQAQIKAHDFLAVLARHPDIAQSVTASVYVAERRWNLRLKNGIDIKLPEQDLDAALQTLARLDREKKLLTRDIALIDLRNPDRVTVRLSDETAQAFEDARSAAKAKAKKKDGDA